MLSRIYYINPQTHVVHQEDCDEYQRHGGNWRRLGTMGNPFLAVSSARRNGYLNADICPLCDRL